MKKIKLLLSTIFLFVMVIILPVEVQAAVSIERFGGNDRYATSIEIAKNLGIDYSVPNKDLYITSGENFPDALSIAAVSARNQRPIILVGKEAISDNVESFIKSQSVNPNIYVIGGTGAISDRAL
ncbi:N-acetylmuramoyl-L-alanine amidase LytC precursor [Clostridium liquoris]|jgi:N-acetylmuramoyl-L-alanine amidase|uniref:N-acetylmuramoyl-L-alanine amidase LytC n=1 Tax=Clostridium liquoris TaxID=1289519 RepID=A0A2T0B154_9CLOT|nr:cell wall-binding repeat-containing protein [Clostridium liquoris]PRR77322.1 N-acetylmuramoyl-L-alanine amidase LytC precursor [Clostridium liquoris]